MASSGTFPGGAGGVGPFLFVFLVGTAAIVLCRLLLPDLLVDPHQAVWFAALSAIVVIVGLGGYYYSRRRAEDISRSGDDLYYLGLLFTLVSLIYALVVLFIFNDGDADLAERTYELIGSFGIALLSTVAGILGRILLQSTGTREPTDWGEPAPPDFDHHAPWIRPDLDLHLLARRMRAEMRGASDAFSHYNRMTMLQAEDTKRHAERMVEEFTRELRENAQSAIAKTESAYQELEGRANATGEALEARLGELAGVLTTFVEQVGSTGRSLAGLPSEVERAQRSIGALDEAVGAATIGLDEKAGSIVRACEALARNAQEHQDFMEQSLQRARTISSRMDSEISEWVRHAERIRAAFATTDEAAGALPVLVEQLHAASRFSAEFAANAGQTQSRTDVRDETEEAATVATNNRTSWRAAFRDELQQQLKVAEKQGKKHIAVQSGELHREVGGYPGPHHRMPVCCDVMYSEMSDGDRVITAPPSGRGATLTIQYVLPRQPIA